MLKKYSLSFSIRIKLNELDNLMYIKNSLKKSNYNKLKKRFWSQ